jgi:hypothetical protein
VSTSRLIIGGSRPGTGWQPVTRSSLRPAGRSVSISQRQRRLRIPMRQAGIEHEPSLRPGYCPISWKRRRRPAAAPTLSSDVLHGGRSGA